MAQYGKKSWDDDSTDMKMHRGDRKYRGHKLSVAIGHNRTIRRQNSQAARKRL